MERPKDYLQQLADYIKKNLTKGYPVESLRVSLMAQGYSRLSVENAMELANKQLALQLPPIKEKPQITYKIIPEPEISENKLFMFFKKILRLNFEK